jgi:hypothetical protein
MQAVGASSFDGVWDAKMKVRATRTRRPLSMRFGPPFALDECDGEDRHDEENRDKRFGVAGKIEVDHGVFRPFTILDGTPHGKVYPVTDLSQVRWLPRNSYAPGPCFQVFST